MSFFHPRAAELHALCESDYDSGWRELLTRFQAQPSIARTYLFLKDAGYPVRISNDLPDRGIVVVHADDLHGALLRARRRCRFFIVCVRSDRGEQFCADIEIVQNPHAERPGRCHFIPVWPQPGLVPRDPARAQRVQTVAFKGFRANLHPGFATVEWTGFLAQHGIQWVVDGLDWAGAASDYRALDWHHFAQTDLVVAMRPDLTHRHLTKPPTKLTNAWAAGVPALLGPESAYRALRRSPEDYIEITSVHEARQAVLRLLTDATLYDAMVRNGLRRAEAFSRESVGQRWIDLLFGRLQRDLRSWRKAALPYLPLGLRQRVRKALTPDPVSVRSPTTSWPATPVATRRVAILRPGIAGA